MSINKKDSAVINELSNTLGRLGLECTLEWEIYNILWVYWGNNAK